MSEYSGHHAWPQANLFYDHRVAGIWPTFNCHKLCGKVGGRTIELRDERNPGSPDPFGIARARVIRLTHYSDNFQSLLRLKSLSIKI